MINISKESFLCTFNRPFKKRIRQWLEEQGEVVLEEALRPEQRKAVDVYFDLRGNGHFPSKEETASQLGRPPTHTGYVDQTTRIALLRVHRASEALRKGEIPLEASIYLTIYMQIFWK